MLDHCPSDRRLSTPLDASVAASPENDAEPGVGPSRDAAPSASTSPHESRRSAPARAGLYDPHDEHDSCGVGFVVDVKGRKSHAIVTQALQVLMNLAHRGACGCEVNTGDGAGILIQKPDKFLRKVAPEPLPAVGDYGVGLVFLPKDPGARSHLEALFEQIITEEGQRLIGWRDVPTDDRLVGPSAVAVEPLFRHIFIARGELGP